MQIMHFVHFQVDGLHLLITLGRKAKTVISRIAGMKVKAQVMMNKPAQQKERQIQHVKIKTRSTTTFTVRYKTVPQQTP